ncbi:MAG: hypothetical protein V3T64_05050, partial [Myxococcota bacterium]
SLRTARAVFTKALLLAALIFGSPLGDAQAVIIETGDGTGNVIAPPDDPGWANLGTRGNLTVVYLGRRWVLTANHVGAGNVVLEGQTYSPVPGSAIQFENPDTSPADLMVFKIFGDPGLRRLDIASFPPVVGDPISAIGNGRNRGSATTFMGLGGYNWGSGHSMRWGSNVVSEIDILVDTTYSFAVTFTDPLDPSATGDEAAGANGDSGGAAFIKIGSDWYLAGTLFAISQYTDQPSTTSIYGNRLFAVDLSFYRDDILAVIEQRSCSDGLDDDGDGFTDYPADPECVSANDDSESIPGVPTLGIPGMVLLIGSMLLAFGARLRLRGDAI